MDFKQFTGAPLNYSLWYIYRLFTGQDPTYTGGISVEVGNASLSSIDSKLPAAAQLTPTVTVTSTSGTVAAGSRVVGFAVTGSAAATVAGTSVPAGIAFDFTAPLGSTLGAITYNATGTSLVITRLA